MDESQEILNIFQTTGAYFTSSHFILVSKKHTDSYVHVRLALAYSEHALTISKRLADVFRGDNINAVVGFTIGGRALAEYVARHLNAKLVLAKKEEKKITLAKHGRIEKGENILVVDDVLTTGNSIRLALSTIRDETQGVLKGVGVVVDRSKKKPDFGIKTRSLLPLPMNLWSEKSCPLCKKRDKPLNLRLADKELWIALAGLPEEVRPRLIAMYSQPYEYFLYDH